MLEIDISSPDGAREGVPRRGDTLTVVVYDELAIVEAYSTLYERGRGWCSGQLNCVAP